MASSESVELTIEQALTELWEMFPKLQIIVSVRDCGDETITRHGNTTEYGIQVGMNGKEFDYPTLDEAMAQVRAWKEQQP